MGLNYQKFEIKAKLWTFLISFALHQKKRNILIFLLILPRLLLKDLEFQTLLMSVWILYVWFVEKQEIIGISSTTSKKCPLEERMFYGWKCSHGRSCDRPLGCLEEDASEWFSDYNLPCCPARWSRFWMGLLDGEVLVSLEEGMAWNLMVFLGIGLVKLFWVFEKTFMIRLISLGLGGVLLGWLVWIFWRRLRWGLMKMIHFVWW